MSDNNEGKIKKSDASMSPTNTSDSVSSERLSEADVGEVGEIDRGMSLGIGKSQSQQPVGTCNIGGDGGDGGSHGGRGAKTKRRMEIWKRIWNHPLWTPKPARYDVDNPPEFTVWINILFAFVSILTYHNMNLPFPFPFPWRGFYVNVI